MATKSIAFKLPDELIQAIESHANATGKDRTAVVVQALKQVFALLPSEVPQATAINEVTPQKQELEEQLNELSELKARFSELEKKVASQTEQIAELSRGTLLDRSAIQCTTALSEHLVDLVTELPIFVHQLEEVRPQATDVLASSYVQIEEVLTTEEKSRLFDYVLQQESAFVPTYILTC